MARKYLITTASDEPLSCLEQGDEVKINSTTYLITALRKTSSWVFLKRPSGNVVYQIYLLADYDNNFYVAALPTKW